MFHACVQRFDGMDEKFFSGELNRAEKTKKNVRKASASGASASGAVPAAADLPVAAPGKEKKRYITEKGVAYKSRITVTAPVCPLSYRS